MTEKEWAEKDYSYNKTRKIVLATFAKMDKELELSSSISSCERRAIESVADFITCRLELAKANYEKMKGGDEND